MTTQATHFAMGIRGVSEPMQAAGGRQPEIPMLRAGIEQEMTLLREAIEELSNRLTGVLREPAPEPPSVKEQVEPDITELGAWLRQTRNGIIRFRMMLAGFSNRLEL